MNDDHSSVCQTDSLICSQHSSVSGKRAAFAHVIDSGAKIERINGSGEFPVSLSAAGQRPVHVVLTGTQSDSLSIWTTNSRHGFISRPAKPADLLTIRFVNSGVLFRDNPQDGGVVVDPTQALLTSFEEMRYQQVSPMFSSTTAAISRAVIQTAWQTFVAPNRVSLPEFHMTADTHTPGLLAIRQTLELYQQHMQVNKPAVDFMTPLLEEILAYQVISLWPSFCEETYHTVTSPHDASVKCALDYIEENLTRKISIAGIANASGLSVRTLQITFRRHMNCSPIQYLIARRLDAVRFDLLRRRDLSVCQIARSWGFVHMSDFSLRFRERFGQTPLQFRTFD